MAGPGMVLVTPTFAIETDVVSTTKDKQLDFSYAVVPSLYTSISGHCSPEDNLQTVLSAELQIQQAVNNFRSRGKDTETLHHSVADGLRKHRLLTDHGVQVAPGDLLDLNDVDDFIHRVCDQLQATDTEYNHMFDMIPVEIDRQIGEVFTKLHGQVAEGVRNAQKKSLKKLDLMEKFFDEQYEDAVASLLRWWKKYDEMQINNFQKTACLADDDAQAIVRKHRKQMALHRETIERINKQTIALKNHLAELNNPKGQAEEAKSRTNIIDAQMEFPEVNSVLPSQNVVQKTEDEIVANLVEVHALREQCAALEILNEANKKILVDKKLFLDQLTAELAASKREHRKTLDEMHTRLQEERRSLQITRDEYDQLLEQLLNPAPPDPAELAEEDQLRQQIAHSQQQLFQHNQQLRLIQLELRSIDKIYDQRFQQLQKIGFMLRNETYVRRTLERKFFKNANYLNLKELMRMEGSGQGKKPALDEQDLYGTESVSGSGDQLQEAVHNERGKTYEQENYTIW
ncbi:uncharacterized protein LOC129600904 [Paramacrobiotus metropolitanus]|uniref:uncharacterized protein LOC129600904 n=1 Tax=Paramacrobiotus metropolitanus TaxID=2943436 RepID=UPI0024461A89|nr:uncharacterized protein LOC129600904 [Paramacrobiotus metropolitanus]